MAKNAKGECIKGGNHTWGKRTVGVQTCGKCGANRKAGEKPNDTSKTAPPRPGKR